MSETIIELDPRRTATLEPSEGDSGNEYWISPFDVPRRIFLDCGSGINEIRTVRFDYPGGETGETQGLLDDRTDPRVVVVSGRSTGRILRLIFERPISLGDLTPIGDRLLVRASSFNKMGTRFSFQMIARILRDWDNAVQPLD